MLCSRDLRVLLSAAKDLTFCAKETDPAQAASQIAMRLLPNRRSEPARLILALDQKIGQSS